MKRRTVKKQFWFSRDEAQDLQKKAKKTCLTEAALVRLLVRGYEPKERPDERFYDVMRQLSSIGNNINQLAAQANSLSFVDAQKLQKEADRWHMSDKQLKSNMPSVPIWKKMNLTVEEASEYSGIGTSKIKELSNSEDCPFVLWNGAKRLIKRKQFEEYLSSQYSL